MKKIIQKVFTGFFAFSITTFGTTYTVDDNGTADFNKIQNAIYSCLSGDTIIVQLGIYKGPGNRDIDFMGRNIEIRSIDPNDPNIVSQTIIDCNGTPSEYHRGFYFHSNENSSSVISGLTIINGFADYGGGIYCVGSNPTIKKCFIKNNYTQYYGGGIYCVGSNPTIKKCFIKNNYAQYYGGGINCSESSVIDGCKIDDNEAGNGGGIFCQDAVSIKNCIISRNRTQGGYGGGIYSYDKQSTMSNCEIIGNKSSDFGGGVYGNGTIANCTIVANVTDSVGGGVFMNSYGIEIFNSIIWGNVGNYEELFPGSSQVEGDCPMYSCIQYDDPNDPNNPFTENGTNIFDNPQFVRMPDDGGDGFGDNRQIPGDEGANDDLGDLHIKIDSPCINLGTPNFEARPDKTDIDGEPRVAGGRVDIGADEYLPIIATTKPVGSEIWEYGSLHTIEWVSTGCDGQNVDMIISIVDGNFWSPAAEDLDNTGSYKWQCPNALFNSYNCQIKVVPSVPDSNVLCISSGQFRILKSKYYDSSEAQWPSLAGNFDRRGISEYIGPRFGCVKWVFDTNGPVTSSVTVGEDGTIYAACEDGNLYAIDSNGTLIWKYNANTPLISSPTIGTDGTIYVGGRDGKLYAIDKNGNIRWTHSTGGWIYSSPAVSEDGKVFVGSMDGTLYALGPDGSELWQFETAGLGSRTSGSIIASPAIDANGTVYIMGLYDPNLYALDPNNGSIIWASNLRGMENIYKSYGWSAPSPVVGDNGTIYVVKTYDPNLYAIEPNNGDIKWAVNLADPCSSWFGVEFSDKVYITSTQWRLGKWYKTNCFSEPVIEPDGTIYISFDDPYLRAIDPNGSIKWVTRLGIVGGFTMSVGSDGLIYAACDDSHLYVVDSNGNELSRFIDDGMLSWSVLSEDGTIIVSDSNNKIWSISSYDCNNIMMELHRPADLYGDGIVNFYDIAVFAKNWLECTDRFMGTMIDGPASGHCNYPGDEIYFEADVDRNLYINTEDLSSIANEWLKE